MMTQFGSKSLPEVTKYPPECNFARAGREMENFKHYLFIMEKS